MSASSLLGRSLFALAVMGSLAVAAPSPKRPDARAEKRAKEVARQLVLAEYVLVQERDPKAAAVELQKALKIDPKHVRAALLLARAQSDLGDAKKSLQTLQQLSQKNPTDLDVLRTLARARFQAKEIAAAIALVERLVSLAPTDAEAHLILFQDAIRRHRAGEGTARAKAIEAGKRYLQLTPNRRSLTAQEVERTVVELVGTPLDLVIYDARREFDRAFNSSGLIQARMDKARAGFVRCVAERPSFEPCHYYLGLIHASVKAGGTYDPQKARAELELARNLPEAQVELGVLLRRGDDLLGARAALERALELRPGDPRATCELGVVAKLAGREEEAVQLFADAFRRDRGSPAGVRALDELTRLRPQHDLARSGVLAGPAPVDIFSSQRYLAAVSLIERRFGGVEEGAPEEAAVRAIVMRLLEAAGEPASRAPRVAVLRSPIVNALALPSGNVYVTRGLLDEMKKQWPDRPIDRDHGPLAHVLAHELAHVVKAHSRQSALYQQATRDASAPLPPAVLVHTTRLQEVEADRISILLAFLAGYDPRAGIEFFEAVGQKQEIPPGLDHPTFDERIDYLEEFWSNDVRHAFVAYKNGVARLEQAGRLEGDKAAEAFALYQQAVEDFRRFRETVQPTKEVLSNLGVALAKLGALAGPKDGVLNTWNTPFSVEREQALKYRGLGAPGSRGPAAVPWQLEQAIGVFREALAKEPTYRRAAVNLAAAQLGAGAVREALEGLGRLPAATGAEAAEAQNLIGVGEALVGRSREAERAFQGALAAQADYAPAQFNLGRLYRSTARPAEASAAFRAFVARVPDGPWAEAARRELAPPPAAPPSSPASPAR